MQLSKDGICRTQHLWVQKQSDGTWLVDITDYTQELLEGVVFVYLKEDIMKFPNDRLYHAQHLWAQKQPDGTWLAGITDYAQDMLGEVIFVELPEVGAAFRQGYPCAFIESVKATSGAVMPISGKIAEINKALADAPELLNTDPYGLGWLVRIASAPQAGEGCMSAEEYAAVVKE